MENKGFENNIQLLDSIVYARYSRFAKSALDEAIDNGISVDDLSDSLIEVLVQAIEEPSTYDGYTIPAVVKDNRVKFLPELNRRIDNIKRSRAAEKRAALYDLFVDGNWGVRYATCKWFLLNPGLSLEIIEVSDSLPGNLKKWLKEKYDVNVSDSVLHRHVVSNERRESFKELGFEVQYLHWDKAYYVEAMKLIQKIVNSNPKCKGILSDGSWTYNPKLYEIAPDGKPFASFAFLSDDRLVGDRFFLEKAELGNDQENQYLFAISSDRRKKFIDEGILDIDVYAAFYPRKRLLFMDFDHL